MSRRYILLLFGALASLLSPWTATPRMTLRGGWRPFRGHLGPLPPRRHQRRDPLGIAAPFSGPARDLGQQMRIGIEAAFRAANDDGGVNGRMLHLIAADDGYEPARTSEAMKQLYEKDQVSAS